MLKVENSVRYKIAQGWQIFSWIISYISYRYIWVFKKNIPLGLLGNGPVIIVSNHKSMYDPWFLTMTLPFSIYKKIVPIRFLASQNFNNSFLNAIYFFIIYPFIYFLNGVLLLPPRRKNGILTIEDKTASSIAALKRGETLIIFAEGKVWRYKGVHEFKRGPAYIQKNTQAPILLVSIRFQGYWWLPWHKRIIHWDNKHIFIPEEIIDDSEKATEWLRQGVIRLYENNIL